MSRVVIIGNGVAGITTARYIRKQSDHEIIVIGNESRYFYSRPALMYLFMGHMTPRDVKPYEDWFWSKNRIQLKQAHVDKIHTKEKSLDLADGGRLSYDKLVIATGSKSNYFGWPGQELKGVQGLYNLQDLQMLEENCLGTRHAVIVGGGLIGVEMAEMLRTRGIEVTFLVRETHYWGNILREQEGQLIGRHLQHHGVQLHCSTELDTILGDDSGRVRAVRTKDGTEIECQLVGITAGVSPNIALAKRSGIPTQRGVLINDYLETSLPDVYATGDCAEIEVTDGRNRIEQLWYTGRMQGEALAATICGKRTAYNRGIWFNSAKFFDIEYHTYGYVHPVEREGEASMVWAKGDRCIRLVYKQSNQELVGMNAFGIRYRHPVFERWLGERRDIRFVLTHLREANFDPEFYREFEPEMVAAYNRSSGQDPIQLKRRKWFSGVMV